MSAHESGTGDAPGRSSDLRHRGHGHDSCLGARRHAAGKVQGLVGLRRRRHAEGVLRRGQAQDHAAQDRHQTRPGIFLYFPLAAKTTGTIGIGKFELFTKDEGAFVEKPEMETKLVDAMKTGTSMKIDGKSARGTATSDTYSLDGLGDALDRAAKECSG
jgi:hypothetical protein